MSRRSTRKPKSEVGPATVMTPSSGLSRAKADTRAGPLSASARAAGCAEEAIAKASARATRRGLLLLAFFMSGNSGEKHAEELTRGGARVEARIEPVLQEEPIDCPHEHSGELFDLRI